MCVRTHPMVKVQRLAVVVECGHGVCRAHWELPFKETLKPLFDFDRQSISEKRASFRGRMP